MYDLGFIAGIGIWIKEYFEPTGRGKNPFQPELFHDARIL